MTALPPPPRPRTTSYVGPAVTTSLGVVALLVALVVGLVSARTFIGLVTTDVLTASGAPGPSAVAAADAPGMTTATLEAGERYAVHLAYDGSSEPRLTEDVLLRAPSGTVVAADDDPAVDGRFGVGSWSVVSVSAFTAPESGTYEVAVPAATVQGARVVLAPDQDVAPFVGGILGTIAGVFGVLVVGAFGAGLLLAGVIWWVLRARARRAVGGAPA
ncbi:hypothetical protein [Cellulomonas telluris]|uniref:hypothetical protein n=1 Tax=Cellulomonas telluris TaxID=2306636 RepID=UPI0010A93CF6|nr:hypothetical protein [Cellulomonas telluris]